MEHDFQYISKRDPKVKDAYFDLMLLLREVREELKKHYTFQHDLVGSYARNMITYDQKSNVGFDFDVNIYPNDDEQKFTPEQIKLLFKKALDHHVKDHGFDYAEDSTRVLTIKIKDRKHSRVLFSVDFAFVYNYTDEDGTQRQQYIRHNKKQGVYAWEEQPKGYYMLPEKVSWIKTQGLWTSELRPYYLAKKNANENPDMHSRSIFAQAVNEIYDKYGYYQ